MRRITRFLMEKVAVLLLHEPVHVQVLLAIRQKLEGHY